MAPCKPNGIPLHEISYCILRVSSLQLLVCLSQLRCHQLYGKSFPSHDSFRFSIKPTVMQTSVSCIFCYLEPDFFLTLNERLFVSFRSRNVWKLEMVVAGKDAGLALLGSLSNHDDDGNENVKKQ